MRAMAWDIKETDPSGLTVMKRKHGSIVVAVGFGSQTCCEVEGKLSCIGQEREVVQKLCDLVKSLGLNTSLQNFGL